MITAIPQKRFNDLVRLVSNLTHQHQELLELIRAKIAAMRQANTGRLSELSEREQEVGRSIKEREGFRRQMMDSLGGYLGLESQAARALSMSQLAARLEGKQRSRLLESAGQLRELISSVSSANRVAGAIAREIVAHLRWVFDSVRPRAAASVSYSGAGVLLPQSETKIIDAVG